MQKVNKLTGSFDVSLNLPGSKSITMRDVVLASLAQGQSTLEFPAECDDFSRISQALIKLGIAIHQDECQTVYITGTGGHFRDGPILLEAGLSGTAARFLIASHCSEVTKRPLMAWPHYEHGRTKTCSMPCSSWEHRSVPQTMDTYQSCCVGRNLASLRSMLKATGRVSTCLLSSWLVLV